MAWTRVVAEDMGQRGSVMFFFWRRHQHYLLLDWEKPHVCIWVGRTRGEGRVHGAQSVQREGSRAQWRPASERSQVGPENALVLYDGAVVPFAGGPPRLFPVFSMKQEVRL